MAEAIGCPTNKLVGREILLFGCVRDLFQYCNFLECCIVGLLLSSHISNNNNTLFILLTYKFQPTTTGFIKMVEGEPVTLEYKGRIAIITIDNEKKLNALTQDGYYLIAKFMREVATRDEVFITVLTGKGKIRNIN